MSNFVHVAPFLHIEALPTVLTLFKDSTGIRNAVWPPRHRLPPSRNHWLRHPAANPVAPLGHRRFA